MLVLQSVDPIRKNLGIRIPISERTLRKLIDKHLSKNIFLADIAITFEDEIIRLKGKYKGIGIVVEIVPLHAHNGILFLLIRKVKPINWSWVLGKFVKRYSFLELEQRILAVDLHQLKAFKGFPVRLWRTFEFNNNKLWIGM